MSFQFQAPWRLASLPRQVPEPVGLTDLNSSLSTFNFSTVNLSKPFPINDIVVLGRKAFTFMDIVAFEP